MPDRVIRDELLDSDRFLDLPTDTDRWCFVALVLRCDDFGNLEGGERRMFRFLHRVSQVKSLEDSARVLLHLTDADLLRGYKSEDGRELWHIPRFRPHRQYLVRKVPASPWDHERKVGKNRRVENRGLAKSQELGENIATTSLPRSSDMAEGVGVGVGEALSPSLPSEARTLVGHLPDARLPQDENPTGKALRDAAKRVIAQLNRIAGRRYEPGDANLGMVLARMREGYSERELCAIAAVMSRKWKGDEKMDDYLRPKTLYNKTNAAQYRALLPANQIEERTR